MGNNAMVSNLTDEPSYTPESIHELSYKPNDILGPWECSSLIFPYDGVFGDRKQELVAAHIVSLSQKKGYWVVVMDFHPDYNTPRMIRDGFLERVYIKKRKEWSDPASAPVNPKKIGVKLTPKAIEKLAQYIGPAQSAYMGKCCNEIISRSRPAGKPQPKVSVPDEVQTAECFL